MTDVDRLIDSIQRYSSRWPNEAATAARYIALLYHHEALFRTHLPGHITGSAFIVNSPRTHTLLVHHARLNRWLQPGGHADGEAAVANVARREANEETALINLRLVSSSIYDLDIHPIPSRAETPAHDHYDIRYLFEGNMNDKIAVSEESHDVRWIPLDELERFNNEPSLLRLRNKLWPPSPD